MLAVIIFMMLVYRESLKESCLSYEKLVNEIEKICNRWKKAPFLSISYKNIIGWNLEENEVCIFEWFWDETGQIYQI